MGSVKETIEALNSTKNHKNVIPPSVTSGAKSLLKDIISVKNILGSSSELRVVVTSIYVGTEKALSIENIDMISKIIPSHRLMIIPHSDKLFIPIN